MDVRNCRGCGKLYNYVVGMPPLCQSCIKELEDKFAVVKEYIYNNPGAGIAEIAQATDVTTSQLQKWIREERLTFSEDSVVGIECENCGKMIKTGRFCKTCKETMATRLENVYKKEEPKAPTKATENGKMRFINSHQKQ